MKKTLAYIRPYSGGLTLGLVTKTVGSAAELVLPYILSYIIDDLTPLKDSGRIYLMGGLMLFFCPRRPRRKYLGKQAFGKGCGQYDARYPLRPLPQNQLLKVQLGRRGYDAVADIPPDI